MGGHQHIHDALSQVSAAAGQAWPPALGKVVEGTEQDAVGVLASPAALLSIVSVMLIASVLRRLTGNAWWRGPGILGRKTVLSGVVGPVVASDLIHPLLHWPH